MAWLKGDDTGTSSRTICGVFAGIDALDGRKPSTPMAPSDFGRCFRLLAAFPEWRARLPEVAARHPNWTPFVAAWPDLEARSRR